MFDAITELLRATLTWMLATVFYWPGWAMLKIATFGRYPPASPREHNREFVAVMAIVVLAMIVTAAFSN